MAKGGHQLVSLGSQAVIVVVDARDLRLQAPKVGTEPFVLLGPFGLQAVKPKAGLRWPHGGPPLTADYFFSVFKSPHAKAFIVTP